MTAEPIRLIIQQPSLAKYRVPVFRELAKCSDIDMTLLYGTRKGIPNVDAEGFKAVPVRLWHKEFRGQNIFWHSAQWNSASKSSADVLILTWNPRFTSLVPTLLKAKATGVKTILWGHGYSKKESKVRTKVRHAVARLATAILFYNHTAADSYIEAGWDPESIFVARNSLDQAPIQRAKQTWESNSALLEEFKAANGLNPGPNILFVSRLEFPNRLDLLVQAVAKMKADFPNLKVNIIGKGEPERERIAGLVTESKVEEHFNFVGSIYEEEKLAPWFLSSDVFCYPANIGLSILHAFGYGLPVVTSDDLSGQNPEIESLKPGVNGELYRHNDPAALAEVLESIITNPEKARAMSAEAIRTVSTEFSLQNMVDQMAAAVRYCARQTKS